MSDIDKKKNDEVDDGPTGLSNAGCLMVGVLILAVCAIIGLVGMIPTPPRPILLQELSEVNMTQVALNGKAVAASAPSTSTIAVLTHENDVWQITFVSLQEMNIRWEHEVDIPEGFVPVGLSTTSGREAVIWGEDRTELYYSLSQGSGHASLNSTETSKEVWEEAVTSCLPELDTTEPSAYFDSPEIELSVDITSDGPVRTLTCEYTEWQNPSVLRRHQYVISFGAGIIGYRNSSSSTPLIEENRFHVLENNVLYFSSEQFRIPDGYTALAFEPYSGPDTQGDYGTSAWLILEDEVGVKLTAWFIDADNWYVLNRSTPVTLPIAAYNEGFTYLQVVNDQNGAFVNFYTSYRYR